MPPIDLTILLGQLFNGVSIASILLLAAIGLALSFGLMRVINMAHGEFIMMGGYLTYLTLKLFPHGAGYLLGMVVAFVVTALFGALLECTLIRRLYGRPLDTLLATWGVSLILQQAARSIFGPIGDEVTAPLWMAGSLTIGSVALPWSRLFIIVLAAVILASVILLFKYTRLGTWIKAVYQDREMAELLGVNTGRVDLIVFAIGSGIAGIAGSALALIAPVTPTVGQAYIVYAFLVVILGGLGSLFGTFLAALIIGIFSATTQIFTNLSTSNVLLLLLVIGFIQLWPQGIRPNKSRALEET